MHTEILPIDKIDEYEDRWYQTECVDSIINSLYQNPEDHPVVVVPTGGGKTVILGRLIRRLNAISPESDVLVLSHTEEIVQQDYTAISKFFGGIQLGLWSSGLGVKRLSKITVGSVQSMYRMKEKLNRFNIVIIDEAHSIPHKGKGMYRSLLEHVGKIRIGMTATAFRTGTGRITEGEGALFTKVVYDLSSVENFNRLIEEGYLCNLITKNTQLKIDTEGVKITAGDFNKKGLSEAVNRMEITKEAVEESIKFGENYKKWLVFSIDTEHADNISNRLQDKGVKSVVLHSKAEGVRKEIIKEFKEGDTRALVTVGMATTGFDFPGIDLILMLRPTRSPVLHVQMIGRGLRPYPGKDHCLVLDFGGNIERLGPINDIKIPGRRKKKVKTGEMPVKTCPNCQVHNVLSAKECVICGYLFPRKESLRPKASKKEVIAKKKKVVMSEEPTWLEVNRVMYYSNRKAGKKPSVRVVYDCGLRYVSEWVCLEHEPGSWPYKKARMWIYDRYPYPEQISTVGDLLSVSHQLPIPSAILAGRSNGYDTINKCKF